MRLYLALERRPGHETMPSIGTEAWARDYGLALERRPGHETMLSIGTEAWA